MRAASCLPDGPATARLVDVSGTGVAVGCRRLAPGRAVAAAREAFVREAAAAIDQPAANRLRLASLLPSGRPIGLIDGSRAACGISLSHVADLLAVAVGPRATVGVDLVDVASAGRGLEHWFDESQRRLATAIDADCGTAGYGRAVLWAGREAAFKAAAVDAPFAPAAIRVVPARPWNGPLPDLHDDDAPVAAADWSWRASTTRQLHGTVRLFDCGVPDATVLLAVAVVTADSSQE